MNSSRQFLLENSFFPRELIFEQQRLTNEEDADDEVLDEDSMLDALDKQLENLLQFFENAKKTTDILCTRIQQRKRKIIKEELEIAKKNELIKKVNSTNSSNEDLNEYKTYLCLFQEPKLFDGLLKTHQIEGLLWIRTLFENGLNGIIADDMGLGKAIQIIAFICFLFEKGVKGSFLVITPLFTIPKWLSEFSKCCPQIPTLLYHGPENERIKIWQEFIKTRSSNNFDKSIIITTYEVVHCDIKYLKDINWKFITIDSRKLKNFNASMIKTMGQLRCTGKLILTGIIPIKMSELWSLLNLLMPKLFEELEHLNSLFKIDYFGSNIFSSMTKIDNIYTLMRQILNSFILRRKKKDADLNLPPKKEMIVYAPMTEMQQELYETTLNKHIDFLLDEIKDTDNITHGVMPVKIIHNPFIQLTKVVNHPYLVHMPLIPGTNQIIANETIVEVSGKFQVLDALLTKLKLLGHKVLLICTMTQLLDVIEKYLIFRTYKYARLDGIMSIQSRMETMKKFNIDPDCFLMIMSSRVGALGLNLTSADTVILFDSDWNPQCDLQTQDGCYYRVGQEKPVIVYHFCSKDTVDEQILQNACAKRELEKRLIFGSGSFNTRTKLTAEVIVELMNLIESSNYIKNIQSNGFIFTDEELNVLLDRSNMIESVPKSNVLKSTQYFKVLNI